MIVLLAGTRRHWTGVANVVPVKLAMATGRD
jgi:hypothetical protein